MEQFVWATKNIDKISPKACREWAMNNYSLDAIAPMYEEFFQTVKLAKTPEGWYSENPDRDNLDWMNKKYPSECFKC
jgi:hypothetical protein